MQAQDSFLKKPIFWVLLGGVAIAGFVMTQPEATTGPAITAKKSPKVTVSRSGSTFTEEDFKAKFMPVNSTPKNAFKPVIAKGGASLGTGGPSNVIPTAYASGEGSWILTGTAEIDGVPMALLENKQTMDGVFLKQGERWKSAVVERITSNSVVLGGPAGSITLSWIVADEATTPAAAAGTQPVNPMQGPIGIGPGVPMGGGSGWTGGNNGGGRRFGGGNNGGGRGNGGGGRGNGGGGGRGEAPAPAAAAVTKGEAAVSKEVIASEKG